MDDIKNYQFLEIGAGENPTPGYIHNDMRALDDIELVCDALEIRKYIGDHRFMQVKANHILEHFGRLKTVEVLSNWFDLLEDGGTLHIEVPNFEWQTRAHQTGLITDEEAIYFVYGEQNHEGNFHMTAFTESYLEKCLFDAGFKSVTVHNIGQVLVADAVR